MPETPPLDLSRRERQIMEGLYRLGPASAADVRAALPDPPSYSAVRAMLRLLEAKGHIRHQQIGKKYVYTPRVARDKVRRSALRRLVDTFFGGSVEGLMASLLDIKQQDLSDAELERLARLIEQARKEGR